MDILHDHTLFSKTTDVDLGALFNIRLWSKANNRCHREFRLRCYGNPRYASVPKT